MIEENKASAVSREKDKNYNTADPPKLRKEEERHNNVILDPS